MQKLLENYMFTIYNFSCENLNTLLLLPGVSYTMPRRKNSSNNPREAAVASYQFGKD